LSALRTGSWLLLNLVVRLAVGLFLTAWVARALGPAGFGEYQSTIALVLTLSTLASLGMTGVVMQAAAVSSEPATLLGTALRVRAIAGLFLLLGSLTMQSWWLPASLHWSSLCVLLVLLTQAFDVVEYGFINKQHTRPVALVHMGALLVTSLATWMGLRQNAGTDWFIATFTLEYLLVAAAYLLLRTRSAQGTWKFDSSEARMRLRQAFPMLISTLSYMLYLRIDTVMVQAIAGSHQTGLYSASARIAQMGLVLPSILINAVSAGLALNWRDNRPLYQKQVLALYSLLSTVGLIIALASTLLAPWLIALLFGSSFQGSAPLLAWHAWIALLLFVRTGLDRILVTEGLALHSMQSHLAIAMLNLLLNAIFIPYLGALGAVYASLMSILLGGYIIPTLRGETRPGMLLAWQGLLGPLLWVRPDVRRVLQDWKHR